MERTPIAFISYSHDSPSHRRWVLNLSTQLRANGVDVILDQWDLRYGQDLTAFVEDGIGRSDKVLAICTGFYVKKANEGSGGVGYERLILTADLVRDLSTTKIIPVIRQASGDEVVPTFLGTRYYVDFRNEAEHEEKITELVHELHQVPIERKPRLGRNPFSSLPSGQESPSSAETEIRPTDIPAEFASASDAYHSAIEIARNGDRVGWRKLVKQIRPRVFDSIVQWRQSRLDHERPQSIDQLEAVIDDAVSIVAPIMNIALAGVESGREHFVEQKSLLDDLLNIPNWERSGYTTWVEIPSTLAYVYHSLHGAVALSTNQDSIAMSLARHRVISSHDQEYRELWKRWELVGGSSSLGDDCRKGWSYLVSAFDRWEWLHEIFEDELEFRSSLSAYYFALSIRELASYIASNNPITSLETSLVQVPLGYFVEQDDVCRRAVSLLVRSKDTISALCYGLEVTRDQTANSWDAWMNVCRVWVQSVYHRPLFFGDAPYARFFQALGPFLGNT